MQDLNDLIYFAEVVDRGGFAAAGRSLGLPKSRISRRVAELEARLGVREQKRWERGAPLQDTKPVGGPEAFARYEHELTGERPVRMFAQYELFSYFGDLAHTTNLVTAGLTVQLAKYLSADFAYRAFHETRPKWAGDDARGFGEWSSRQEATIGLSVLF